MKRVIKFRGQCLISKEWVFGNLIHGVGSKNGNIYILPNKINLAYVKYCDPLDGVKVHPETVGQFTGLLDKNGVEIYEHDKLDNEEVVTWSIEQGCYFAGHSPLCMSNSHREIIGNIHENKDLLK